LLTREKQDRSRRLSKPHMCCSSSADKRSILVPDQSEEILKSAGDRYLRVTESQEKCYVFAAAVHTG
jgi:hypothetical protein